MNKLLVFLLAFDGVIVLLAFITAYLDLRQERREELLFYDGVVDTKLWFEEEPDVKSKNYSKGEKAPKQKVGADLKAQAAKAKKTVSSNHKERG